MKLLIKYKTAFVNCCFNHLYPSYMLLLVLSVAPGLAIIWYIYMKDKYDREPRKYLIISFLLGMASTIPAIVFEKLGTYIFGDIASLSPISFIAFFAFVIVGVSEEGLKYLVVRFYAFPKKAFNEPFDGIVYSVMVAMGFATLENIGYVQQHGIATAILRMFLSVPAHASFGILMGYYIGLAKFNKQRSRILLVKGLLLSIFFHGAFDFFLFLQDNLYVTQKVSSALLLLGAILSFYIAVRLSIRSIKLHQELSRIDFENKNRKIK